MSALVEQEALKITRPRRSRRYDHGAAVHTIIRCITNKPDTIIFPVAASCGYHFTNA